MDCDYILLDRKIAMLDISCLATRLYSLAVIVYCNWPITIKYSEPWNNNTSFISGSFLVKEILNYTF